MHGGAAGEVPGQNGRVTCQLAADVAHLRVGCWSLRVVTGNML